MHTSFGLRATSHFVLSCNTRLNESPASPHTRTCTVRHFGVCVRAVPYCLLQQQTAAQGAGRLPVRSHWHRHTARGLDMHARAHLCSWVPARQLQVKLQSCIAWHARRWPHAAGWVGVSIAWLNPQPFACAALHICGVRQQQWQQWQQSVTLSVCTPVRGTGRGEGGRGGSARRGKGSVGWATSAGQGAAAALTLQRKLPSPRRTGALTQDKRDWLAAATVLCVCAVQ